jgi:hypothetical protein
MGNTPLPEVPTGLPVLSLDTVRQLIFILNSLKAIEAVTGSAVTGSGNATFQCD